MHNCCKNAAGTRRLQEWNSGRHLETLVYSSRNILNWNPISCMSVCERPKNKSWKFEYANLWLPTQGLWTITLRDMYTYDILPIPRISVLTRLLHISNLTNLWWLFDTERKQIIQRLMPGELHLQAKVTLRSLFVTSYSLPTTMRCRGTDSMRT